MSRDDTVGIFVLRHKGKKIYTVIHVQGIEDYENWEYFNYMFTLNNYKWTYNYYNAKNIAKSILRKNPYCEYGIHNFQCHKLRNI